ncbi:MAG: diacylglycerol kinase [Gemmataceae bacterium]|nr:diacylglycerol kinase [Gemmataceae bacterium]
MAFEPAPIVEEKMDPDAAPKRRRWRAKFRDALRGLKLGIRGHSSFFVHFFVTALVLAAAGMLRCSVEQWCVLLLCIGGVLTAELFNSAIETLFRGLDEATKERAWPSLDIAAGAVLLASIVAALVGTLVFVQRLTQILWPEGPEVWPE